MNNLSKTILAAAAVACSLFTQANAAPITGQISFAGSVAFDTTSLATATEVKTWENVFGVSGESSTTNPITGTFALFVSPGNNATMAQPWVFNPSTPTPSLWSVGGFTFNLLTSTILTQNANFLNIIGTGSITTTNAGYDTTPGTWSFTVNNSNGQPSDTFSFAANTAATPDGGSAVALLGIALTGIEGVRRMIRSRKA